MISTLCPDSYMLYIPNLCNKFNESKQTAGERRAEIMRGEAQKRGGGEGDEE